MRLNITSRAKKDYEKLPDREKRDFRKQVDLLLENIHHPSLKTKKYVLKKYDNPWQARVNQKYRFYFHIEGDIISIVAITNHPK